MAGGFRRIDEYNKSLTAEQRKANARKAGVANGECQKEISRLRKKMAKIDKLRLKETGKIPKSPKTLKEFADGNMETDDAKLLALNDQCLKGNVNALRLWLQLMGALKEEKDVTLRHSNPFEELSTEELLALMESRDDGQEAD